MKKIFTVIAILLTSSALYALDFSFGIEGAAGRNTMNVETGSVVSDFDCVPGYRFGGSAELAFNSVTALETKVLFHHGNGYSCITPAGKTKVSFQTVDVPLLLKLTFTGIESHPGRLSLFAGPEFSWLLGNVQESVAGTRTEGAALTLNQFVMGIEAGCEYAFTQAEGFRTGLSVDCDLSDFSGKDGTKANRFSIMPYVGYRF